METKKVKIISKDFSSIGEGTYLRRNGQVLVIKQRIKLHLIITTALAGIILGLWFKLLALTIFLCLIGLLEFFVFIKVTIDKNTGLLVKGLYLFSWRFFNLYKLTNLSTFTLTEYESGRGETATVTSYDLGFSINDKTKELLAFAKQSTRHSLFQILSEFLITSHTANSTHGK